MKNREFYITGKIKGQKLFEGHIYISIQCGINEYMFRPKSNKQQMLLMKLRKEKKDLCVKVREKLKGDKCVTLIKFKILTERDKDINKLIKYNKTKKYKRIAQEDELNIKERAGRMGADSKHKNHITRLVK